MTGPVALSLRQFTEAWRVMCTRCPGHKLASENGVEYVFGGLPIPFFNMAFVTQDRVSTEALAEHGRRSVAWAAATGLPWMFVVTRETLEPEVDAVAVLEACGLGPAMPLTGMLAKTVLPGATVPVGLELTVPQDDAGCAALYDVNAAAYGMDLEAAKADFGRTSFWSGHIPVLGRVGGRIVSCAAVLMVDGHRYVALVATEPGEQRKGYADAAMRRALDVAARTHGELPTVLHATDAGRPIYERMGYAAIASHAVFMEKRFLEGH